jgi:hypothetical protein
MLAARTAVLVSYWTARPDPLRPTPVSSGKPRGDEAMKNLLIPIEESEFLPSVLQSAVLVARRFGSYMEGLHVR